MKVFFYKIYSPIIPYKPIIDSLFYNGYHIAVLRLDLLDAEVSGNKWFKLKYNLQAAARAQKNTIITFGGAYSNHIAATAAACKAAGFKSVGMIRGDETTRLNGTLQRAVDNGMALHFINRAVYKEKNSAGFLNRLSGQYPQAYIIPEGGDNDLGAKGCEDILTKETDGYSLICCAIGTGTTFKGIEASLQPHQSLIGIPVLKGFEKINRGRAETSPDYHFGGYAKHTPELLNFKIDFENKYSIPLDYVYTAKLFYAVFDLINKKKIAEKDRVLIVHSGGLQGNAGYEERYNLNPNRQLIDPQG